MSTSLDGIEWISLRMIIVARFVSVVLFGIAAQIPLKMSPEK